MSDVSTIISDVHFPAVDLGLRAFALAAVNAGRMKKVNQREVSFFLVMTTEGPDDQV